MKTYLNRDERSDFFMLASFMGFMKKHFIDGWWEHGNLTKREKQLIQGSINYSAKAAAEILQRLDIKVGLQLKKDLHDVKIFCLGKTAAEIKIQEHEKESWNRMYQISKYDLDMLCCHAFTACEGCKLDHSKCELKDVFIRLNAEPVNFEGDICPYLQK